MTQPLKIFGWLADMAGCAWYRMLLPLGQLNHAGSAECTWDGKMPEEAWEADVLVAQRTCMPGPSSRLQRIVRSTGKRPMVVLELDDDLMAVPPHNPAANTYNHPEIRAQLVQNITMADMVTVSTPALAERVSKWNQRVVVLPNCVPGDLIAWKPGRYTDRYTVGWQGSQTHAADWKEASEPIRRWAGRMHKETDGRVEFHTMGGLPPTFPPLPRHRHSGWDQDIARYYLRLDWDVALAPLAESTFNRSKSDIRVLEAAALGFPVIASDVVAYRDTVVEGETGFLVRTPADWGKALDTLYYSDQADLDQISAAAKQFARSRAIENNAHLWLEAYLAHR